jgi:Coiled-coil domain-containing protein 24 family
MSAILAHFDAVVAELDAQDSAAPGLGPGPGPDPVIVNELPRRIEFENLPLPTAVSDLGFASTKTCTTPGPNYDSAAATAPPDVPTRREHNHHVMQCHVGSDDDSKQFMSAQSSALIANSIGSRPYSSNSMYSAVSATTRYFKRHTLWEQIESELQPAERNEVRHVLGERIIADNLALKDEVSALFSIWQGLKRESGALRDSVQHHTMSRPSSAVGFHNHSSSRPQTPSFKLPHSHALVQHEIHLLINALRASRQKSRPSDGTSSDTIFRPQSAREHLIVQSIASTGPGPGTVTELENEPNVYARPTTASTSASSRKSIGMSSRAASSLHSSLHESIRTDCTEKHDCDVVRSTKPYLNAFDIDRVVRDIRTALKQEHERLSDDITHLYEHIEEESEHRDLLHSELEEISNVHEQQQQMQQAVVEAGLDLPPTLNELRSIADRLRMKVVGSESQCHPPGPSSSHHPTTNVTMSGPVAVSVPNPVPQAGPGPGAAPATIIAMLNTKPSKARLVPLSNSGRARTPSGLSSKREPRPILSPSPRPPSTPPPPMVSASAFGIRTSQLLLCRHDHDGAASESAAASQHHDKRRRRQHSPSEQHHLSRVGTSVSVATISSRTGNMPQPPPGPGPRPPDRAGTTSTKYRRNVASPRTRRAVEQRSTISATTTDYI